MPHSRLLLLLIALLPGLGLAGLGDVRVCLEALTGGGSCCAPVAEVTTDGCCGAQGTDGAPRAELPDEPQCTLCCLEVRHEQERATRPAAGTDVEPASAVALAPAFLQPLAPVGREVPGACTSSPRQPAERGLVPLRI